MDYKQSVTMDFSGFVLLGDFVPGIVQELRYYSTYHFVGDRIDGYEEPLALLDMRTGKEVDMGSPFDLFSEASHPDSKAVTDEQYENRMFLQNAMTRNGFQPIDCEWRHFSLKNEPYPDVYFEFPVSAEYLRR